MIGNLTSKAEGASSLTLSYPAAGQPRPHAVTSASGSPPAPRGFVYDADGNQQASGNNAAHGFDQENRLSVALDVTPASDIPVPAAGLSCSDLDGNGTVTFTDVLIILNAFGAGPTSPSYRVALDLDASGSVTNTDTLRENAAFGKTCPSVEQRYAYDANGQLVQRSTGMPGLASTSWTNYVDGIYEITNTGAVTKYYQAFGRTVALRQAETLSYPLLDHLGTTVAMTNSTGGVTGTARYWPYGAMRTSTGVLAPVPPATVPPGTDKLYTGQQMESGDAALGLYNYKARFYSTTLGRFVSPDSETSDGWNRFSYVHANPMTFNDPNGHGVTGGGDLDEGYCPATRPDCFGDGSAPVGGNGPSRNSDNGGQACGTYQCMLYDTNCNELCRGLAACALGAGICARTPRLSYVAEPHGLNPPGTLADEGGGASCGPLKHLCHDLRHAVTGCVHGSLNNCLTVPQLVDLIPIAEVCSAAGSAVGGPAGAGAAGVCQAGEGAINVAATTASGVQIIFSDCPTNNKIRATVDLAVNSWVDQIVPFGTEGVEIAAYEAQQRALDC